MMVHLEQGKTVGAMVADALAEQPNPHHDKDIDQVIKLCLKHIVLCKCTRL